MSLEPILVKLTPIAYTTMADQVEHHLREFIINGSIKPGDPIPKETEIAAALGVSRNVVREALSRLRMLGMIESRKKRGMIRTQPNVMKGLELMVHPTLLDEQVRRELFELRLVLEVGLGELLFRRKSDEQLKKLAGIVEREHQATTPIERIRCEIDFHAALYEMAGNETLTRFQNILLPVFEYVVEQEPASDHPSAGSVSHADLVTILYHNDADAFSHAMRQHLMPHLQLL